MQGNRAIVDNTVTHLPLLVNCVCGFGASVYIRDANANVVFADSSRLCDEETAIDGGDNAV